MWDHQWNVLKMATSDPNHWFPVLIESSFRINPLVLSATKSTRNPFFRKFTDIPYSYNVSWETNQWNWSPNPITRNKPVELELRTGMVKVERRLLSNWKVYLALGTAAWSMQLRDSHILLLSESPTNSIFFPLNLVKKYRPSNLPRHIPQKCN